MKSLATYRQKRDFERTSEPRGAAAPKKRAGLRYCIQRHEARRLHFDFRLELDGVLKSWAVPKGPSLDPGEKRLAVEVEDHPLEYGSFEGVIPAGEYGAGRVALWDEGTWEPDGAARKDLKRGRLGFTLRGRRLQGHWTLVRMKSREGKKTNWLLIRSKDGAPAAPSSSFVPPQLATLVDAAPTGDEWIHELKFDGYRILASLEDGAAVLWSRSGKDWTRPFPELAAALGKLRTSGTLLDGELVALDERGVSSFQALQKAISSGASGELVYQVFDLLRLDGKDLRERPLLERKKSLASLLRAAKKNVKYTDHVVGSGKAFKQAACRFQLEGIVSKRGDRPYRSGRGADWLKVKCTREQEFVIGGFTEPKGGREGLGALLLGTYRKPGELVYAGRVGSGFDAEVLRDLRRKLDKLEQREEPFQEGPEGLERRDVRWVRPLLVAQVKFTGWTGDGRLRHPVFDGLRLDKPAAEVGREEPAAMAEQNGAVAGVAISHPDRVVYPELRLTKLDLARYYERVSTWILPQIAGRPLSLLRCPDGREKACFYQKHWTGGGLRTVSIREKSGRVPYAVVDDARGLVTLVQNGVLELHPWGAKAEDVEHPDLCTFDLDPAPGVPWVDVAAAARHLKGRLEELGLESFVKTTGGKGLHVVLPFRRGPDWDVVRTFAKGLANELVREAPERYTATLSKRARTGKIFIDWLRNGRGATAVAAYSTRAQPGAPVATPIAWEELETLPASGHWTVRNLPARLEAGVDPWKGFFEKRPALPKRV